MVLETDRQNMLEIVRHERDVLKEQLRTAIESNNLLEDLLARWLKRGTPIMNACARPNCIHCKELRALVADTRAVLTVKAEGGLNDG